MLLALLATVTALTAVRDSYPSISPDGKRIAFHSNRSGPVALWTANADGSSPRLVFDGGSLGDTPVTPVWSPDGQSIAFAMRQNGATDENESEIYVMDGEGQNLRQLTNVPGDDSHPHWSVDGKRIFFNSARATPDPKAPWHRQWMDIYSMAADGSDVKRHTDCRAVCTYPVPSPDGRFVVHRWTRETPGQNWDLSPTERNSEVFVTPLSGGIPGNLSNSAAYDGWPSWSPDGKWIIFASNRDGIPNSGQVYRVRPDGTGMERLTDGPFSHAQPSVSADGKSIFVYRHIEQAGTEIGQVARIDLEAEK